MSKEVVAEVIALIELGMIAPEDIVKCLRKANSEPAQQEPVPCCGKYETCTQACTPRGRFLGKREALAEQPAQQEPVAAECNFVGTKEWGRCSIEHHNLVQSEPHKWPRYQTRLLYTSPPAQRKPLTDKDIKTRTDEQIEDTFKKCGGKWSGDHWVIEDADLHPFVRTIEGHELNTLRAISKEYNAWIKHHAAGHSYDDFLAKREAAHGIKE